MEVNKYYKELNGLKTFSVKLLDELYIIDRSCLENFDLKPIIEKIKNSGE